MGLQRLDPSFQPWADWIYGVAKRFDLNPRVTSDFRSVAEQTRLYGAYISGRHPYPVAYPGCSWHNYGFARDMVVDDPDWLGAVWSAWGGQYGGRSDPVHYGVRGQPCITR